MVKKSIIVRNPIDLSSHFENVPDYSERRYALWVGRADAYYKRPMMLIELAKRATDIDFIVVMNPHNAYIEQQVRKSRPDNVKILDHVPFNKVEELFSQSFVFVNTSIMEGFPNTFLQAGKYGVPLLSLQVDPDGFIEENECGIVAHGDFEGLVAGLRTIREDQQTSYRFSRNNRAYVEANHSMDSSVQIVNEALQALDKRTKSLRSN